MPLSEHAHDRRAWADMGPDGDRYAADRAAWAGGPAPLTVPQQLAHMRATHAAYIARARATTNDAHRHIALWAAASSRRLIATTTRRTAQ